MADPRLLEYVSKSLKSGQSLQQIRRSLIDAGWPEGQVSEALNQVLSRSPPSKRPRPKAPMGPAHGKKPPKKSGISKTMIIVIVLAIVGALFILSFIIMGMLYSLATFNPAMYTARIPTGFTTLGSPDDWGLQSNGDFMIVIKSRLANPVEISRVDISTDSATDSYEPATPIVVSPGGTYTLRASESGLNLGPQQAGKTYSVKVSMVYNAGGFDHSEEGTLTGTVS
jgi:hypothetical protein